MIYFWVGEKRGEAGVVLCPLQSRPTVYIHQSGSCLFSPSQKAGTSTEPQKSLSQSAYGRSQHEKFAAVYNLRLLIICYERCLQSLHAGKFQTRHVVTLKLVL